LIENLAVRVLGEQLFDFPTQLGISTRKGFGSAIARLMVKVLDLPPAVGGHTEHPYELFPR
jgi:hypothetical protein